MIKNNNKALFWPPALTLSPFLFMLRSLRDPGLELSGGPAGQTDPGPEKPGSSEPRRGVVHHLHQAASQASRVAFAQQHALWGAALLQSSPLKASRGAASAPSTLIHTPPPGPASYCPPVSVHDQPICVFVSRMYWKLFFILFLLSRPCGVGREKNMKLYCI